MIIKSLDLPETKILRFIQLRDLLDPQWRAVAVPEIYYGAARVNPAKLES